MSLTLPFSTIGLFTYLRTYARRHEEGNINSTLESWNECINRVLNGCKTQLNLHFTIEEEKEHGHFYPKLVNFNLLWRKLKFQIITIRKLNIYL